MAIAHKSVISFGLVAIPISMYTAVTENDISFNQLHKEDNSRIRYKKTCGFCGKEVKSDDIIKAYHVLPAPGSKKALELLRQALMSEQKVAIGKTVMGSHENLMVIIPREDGIMIQTMFYDDEVKEIPSIYTKQEVNEAELTLARTLINTMDTPFEPASYHDEYQVKLRKLIEDKIAGKEIISSTDNNQGNVIDLMEALRKSVEGVKAEIPERSAGRPRKTS